MIFEGKLYLAHRTAPFLLLPPVPNLQARPKNFGDPNAIQTRGESRQIAANRGKFHSENNGDHFFKRSRRIATDRIADGIPENNGDHFGGEI